MVERVARAFCAAQEMQWDRLFSNTRALFRYQARVAIEAMRVPTGEMLLAGDYSDEAADPEVVNKVWVAMIDAALKD